MSLAHLGIAKLGSFLPQNVQGFVQFGLVLDELAIVAVQKARKGGAEIFEAAVATIGIETGAGIMNVKSFTRSHVVPADIGCFKISDFVIGREWVRRNLMLRTWISHNLVGVK